ncbi:MAG TPA: S9 family peptidase, partial [Parvularculaceae bacterium]|nr:S9 family peptidase [Parvularculaceae bacterium]
MADSQNAVSADGAKILVTSNETGVFNAYEINAATGERAPLTASESNATFAVSYFPDGGRYIYTADNGGDELNHVFVGGGEAPIDLTPGENLKASFNAWIEDGAAFVIETNERDAKFFDLYRVDAETLERTMLFQNDDGFGQMIVSRDGATLAMIKDRTSADNDSYLKGVATDETPRKITAHEGNISQALFDFTPGGDKLIFGTDEHGEFAEAWSYEVSTGEKAPYLKADWDIMYLSFSPTGRYRVHGVNDDGTTRVSIFDTAKNRAVKTPKGLPDGDIANVRFFPGEKKIAFRLTASNAPSNVYVADIGKNKFSKLTDTLNPEINPADLAKSEVVRYPSYDGLEIPSILTKPLGASAANKVPAIVFVHGGPGGQSRAGYSAMIQHLVNHGYAVLAANNRGSSGYGKTFFHMDDKKHGDVDLKDIVEAKNWLAAQDWVDADNIALMGGSYGGYMTMAALAYHPEVFDAGVDIFGVTNWVRTLTSIPPWWESFKEALYDEMGDPATDGERHRAISPLFHAEKIVKPVLIVQGANDPRVLQVESDEMVAAIRANGVPVEYLLFPDEGHGFLKRENRIAASDAYVSFLDKYLKDAQ